MQVTERIGGDADALFAAVTNGQIETARILLLAGATTTRRHLARAVSEGNADMAWLLLASGADPRWIFSTGARRFRKPNGCLPNPRRDDDDASILPEARTPVGKPEVAATSQVNTLA